ncbi:glycosyltransferase [Thermodesulfobacteriota bacterium]
MHYLELQDNKIKILTFVGYYLPGYKSGGPLRTIVNMVEQLSNDIEFWIVTSDRDLGDSSTYDDVKVDEWQRIGKAQVFYLSPEKRSFFFLRDLIASTPHDILYLNSFFDLEFSIKPQLAQRLLNKLTRKPVIVAPRGEFSPGALALKKTKKSIYIATSKWIGLYDKVTFQASSDYEAKDIIRVLGVTPGCIKVAIDMPEKASGHPSCGLPYSSSSAGALKIIFLSRISSKKNLDFALRILEGIARNIVFDIYGPIEDSNYWAECQGLISKLPSNISVKYCGIVMPSEVKKTFSKYDLFLFPTRGENYGHVIAEALSAGTPVLISDQTPWRNLDSDGFGWDISLNIPNAFEEKIEQLADQDPQIRHDQRSVVQERALQRLLDPGIVEENIELFYSQLKDRDYVPSTSYNSRKQGRLL